MTGQNAGCKEYKFLSFDSPKSDHLLLWNFLANPYLKSGIVRSMPNVHS